jgi:hypothetical protein
LWTATDDVVDALVQAVGDAARAVDELRVELARRLLELGLDELGVGPGLLAVEDARADDDRVDDEARDVVAGLLALAGQAHRQRVVDGEAVDAQAAALHADLCKEWSRSFHGFRVAR